MSTDIMYQPLAIVIAKWHRYFLALWDVLGSTYVESDCVLFKHMLHLSNKSLTSTVYANNHLFNK